MKWSPWRSTFQNLSAVVTAQPERTSGDTGMAMVTLTNKSAHSCAIDGWASISLVNAADEVSRQLKLGPGGLGEDLWLLLH